MSCVTIRASVGVDDKFVTSCVFFNMFYQKNGDTGEQKPFHLVKSELDLMEQLASNQLQALLEQKAGDVKLICNGTELIASRFVLSTQSPVFNTAFDLLQKMYKKKNYITLNVDTCEPDILRELISGMHSSVVDIKSSDFGLKLFLASSYYKVDFIKMQCEDYLVKNITIDNVCDILSAGHESSSSLLDSGLKFLTRSNLKGGLLQLKNYGKMNPDLKSLVADFVLQQV